MADILTFENFQDFLDYNNQEIFDNYFVYYHFIQLLNILESGKLDLFDAYNVVSEDGKSVMCIWVTGNYFVYSNNWNDEIVKILVDKIKIEKYKEFTFLGQRDLIIQLFEKSNIKYEILKDRLIYECIKVTPAIKNKIGIVENATFHDFKELVQMSMENYIEEYAGKGQRTIEDMETAVANGINKSSLFLLRDNNIICSIVQIINDDEDEPMIGNLFTKKEMRNMGYAFSLLQTVTERFLNNGCQKCGLISDISNPASNKVFVNTGYKPIYNWITLFKLGQ
jgi:hypothetical protein